MIPYGLAMMPIDEEEKREYDKHCHDEAAESVTLAQESLDSNTPFISEGLFEQYNMVLSLCITQMNVFQRRWNLSYLRTQEEREELSLADYERTNEINGKFKDLNVSVRDYLSKLDVLD